MRKLINTTLAILLFGCLLNMPYGYYELVRILAMVIFLYFSYLANQQNKKNEVIIYLGLALLFQPFMKVALGRTIWNIVDIVVGIGLVISVFQSKSKHN